MLITKKPKILIPVRNHLSLNAVRVFNSFRENSNVSIARLPESITIRVAGVCNLKCKMCSYICNKQKTKFIDIKIVEKLVNELYSTWPYISITGGEPLLHPKITKIISSLKKGGRFVTLTTNGTLLKKQAEQISKRFLDILIVSIDGPKNIHDEIRGVPGTFQKAVKSINAILAHKIRPLIFLNCSINSNNFSKLEEALSLAKKLGVDGVNFQHLWFLTNEAALPQNQKMIPENLKYFDLSTLWEQLKLVKKSNIVTNIFPKLTFFEIVRYYQSAINFKLRFTNNGTDCPWHHTIIKTSGDIIQCNKYVMGNLGKENFWKIWNGNKFKNFRKEFNEKERFLPECSRCCNYFRD